MRTTYIIAETDENYQTACYYGGHIDVITDWGAEVPRPMWTGDTDLAFHFEDKDEAQRFADDLRSYAWSKGWPIGYNVEEVRH